MRRKFGPPRYAGLTTFVAMAVAALVVFIPAALGSGNAGYTTFADPFNVANLGPTGGCLDNPTGVNCNNYVAKENVYMNGGPTGGNGLDDGNYYFAVLVPGFQNGGFIDGAAGNLSDSVASHDNKSDALQTGAGSGDPSSCRTFHVSSGLIDSYSPPGTCTAHITGYDPQGHFIIDLAPYDDTTNDGGVYILAICKVGATSPNDCKYDAFKVKACTDNCGTQTASDLTGSKTASPAFTREFNWTILKSVDACQVTIANPNGCTITGSSKTLTYTVNVTHDSGHDSGWQVTGDITVSNLNAGDASDVTVNDTIDNGGSCTVSDDINTGLSLDPNGAKLPAGDIAIYPYTCTFGSNPGSGTNSVTVTWNPFLSDGSVTPTAFFTKTAGYTFVNLDPTTVIHNCVNVSDTYVGSTVTGTVCVGDSNPPPFTYTRLVNVPHGCVTVNNTASFAVTDLDDVAPDTDDTGSSSVTAKVCRIPVSTGALTMGFWQNKNGQGIVKNYSGTNCQALKTWLAGFNPFNETALTNQTTCGSSPALGASTATGVLGYIYNVIKAATCTSTSKTCNSMLKAQDLATSLDVYFSDPALGGNRIGAFNGKGNAQQPIGGFQIDLTQVCNMLDGSGGSATCSGAYQDASGVFGGNSCLYVYNTGQLTDILRYAASQSNAGGSTWYVNYKPNQVLAKNVFDAINNTAAFSCT